MSDGTTFDDELLNELEKLRQEIGQLRRSEHELIQRNQDLTALTSVATGVNKSLELQEVVDVAMEKTLTALNINGGLVCLFDQASETFIPASFRNVSDEIVEALTGLSSGQGLPGMVEMAGEPLVIPDLAGVDDHELPAAIEAGLTFFAGIPIRGEGGLLGVLILLDARLRHFSSERLDMLADIGDQVGRAVANARSMRLTKQQIVERMVGEQQKVRLIQKLQKQVSHFNDLLDALPKGLLLIDKDHRVVVSSTPADELMELLVDEDDDEDRPASLGGVAVDDLLITTPTTHSVEVAGRQLEIKSHVVDDSDEEPVLWAVEVTTLSTDEAAPGPPAEATDQPSPSARVKPTRPLPDGRVVAGLSRHLDTALSVIGLYAGMSLTAEVPAKVAERLQIVCEEARRSEQLIRKLVDACQINQYSRRPLNLDELIRELTGELGLSLPENINLELIYGGNDFPVEGDAAALRQMVLNLVANGERAMMPDGGQLRIALRRVVLDTPVEARWPGLEQGDWVQITVTDEGAGIDAEVLPRIYEPFFTTIEAAQGLGLPQVQGIVSQHGGHLDVVTEPGVGTTFAIHLPTLTTEGPPSGLDGVLPQATSSEQSVMVVVPDGSLLSGLVDGLEEMGYSVCAAAEDDAAVTELGRRSVHVVLVEIQDHTTSGERLQRLREAKPGVKALLMSRTSVDIVTMEQQGWNGWIQWPPRLEQLAEVVAQTFRG